jgi:hypothetical protein
MAVAMVLLLAACGEKKEEPKPAEPAKVEYILTYSAGENGRIDGDPEQRVLSGKAGRAVTAVPFEGYHFVTWSDGLESAERRDTEVKANLKLVASFAINQYSLSYSAGANGSIKGASKQILEHGAAGSPVTAVPAAGYHFIGWSDGIETPGRSDEAVTADLRVKANFAVDQYRLSYSSTGNGLIEGVSEQIVDHGKSGRGVTARPAAGYHFDHWSDGLTTASRTDKNIISDLELKAFFIADKYTLNYSVQGNGSLSGRSSQVLTHGESGSLVRAVPGEHHHFVRWSDGVANPERADSGLTSDLQLTAIFAIDQYTLTYAVDANGSISGESLQLVDHGQSGAKVTAVPHTGYHFVGWSDGWTEASRTESRVVSDLQVSASFALNRYHLTYSAGPNGYLQGANDQQVLHGESGSAVLAVAIAGYHFVAWSDGLSSAERLDTKVAGDMQVSAVFAINTYFIGGKLSGLYEGTELLLQNNAGELLPLGVNGEFRFPTEQLDGSRYDVRVHTQPKSPNQTCMVTNGSAKVLAKNVHEIDVTCVLNTYRIGGQVSGLPAGERLVLVNNDTDKLEIKANGDFAFSKVLEDRSNYLIKILNLPQKPNWTCDLAGAAGTLAGQDVQDVRVDCYPKVVLQAQPGIGKVELKWNIQDFNKVTFRLCRASENIPADGFARCPELKGGSYTAAKISPVKVMELSNDTAYWFQLEASNADGRQTRSEVVKATPFGGLNDSGIDWCADETSHRQREGTRVEKDKSCTDLALTYPRQDGFYGRDAAARLRKLPKTGSGTAGFDFSKQCRSGEVAGEGKCPPNPLPGPGYDNWACTRDNVTGLIWEIKTETGLRSVDKTYAWQESETQGQKSQAGRQSSARCEEEDCDSLDYRQAINGLELCGYSDWRLPSRRELLSIIDNGRFNPAIDARYFPNTLPDYYWSLSRYQDQENSAWQVNFLYGEANPAEKIERKPVRLVRGRTLTFGLDNP